KTFIRTGNMELKLYLRDEKCTIELGEIIGKNLTLPSLIYLYGDLGAGKTHLSKGIARGLGITEDITSPTFTLINEYEENGLKLYHLDLYRLDSVNEVLDLGVEDFIDTEKTAVLIEWAEKLGKEELSANLLRINIRYEDEGRTLLMSSDNEKYNELM